MFKFQSWLVLPLFLILVLSCISKGPFMYEICIAEPGTESEILETIVKPTQNSDTAVLKGKVVSAFDGKPIPFSTIQLLDLETDQRKLADASNPGTFNFRVPEGQYQLTISFIGYNTLIDTLALNIDEEKSVNIKLGEAGGFSTYMIKSDKRLSKKQQEKEAIRLAKNKSK